LASSWSLGSSWRRGSFLPICNTNGRTRHFAAPLRQSPGGAASREAMGGWSSGEAAYTRSPVRQRGASPRASWRGRCRSWGFPRASNWYERLNGQANAFTSPTMGGGRSAPPR
jgi:hypothetical protein